MDVTTTWFVGWLGLTVVLGAIELYTSNLITVWFCGGGLAAMLMVAFGQSPPVQIVAFVAASVVLLIATRPAVQRIQKRRVPTNADRIIGEAVHILEPVDGVGGAVRVDGKIWSARSTAGTLHPGDAAYVVDIVGAHVVVSARRDDV